jgi:hypothetical protein
MEGLLPALVDILAFDAIANPPAPRAESTVSRKALHDDPENRGGNLPTFKAAGSIRRNPTKWTGLWVKD